MSYKTDQFYDMLQQGGINMPTKEEFAKNMADPKYRKTLYEGLQAKGFKQPEYGAYESFWSKNTKPTTDEDRAKTLVMSPEWQEDYARGKEVEKEIKAEEAKNKQIADNYNAMSKLEDTFAAYEQSQDVAELFPGAKSESSTTWRDRVAKRKEGEAQAKAKVDQERKELRQRMQLLKDNPDAYNELYGFKGFDVDKVNLDNLFTFDPTADKRGNKHDNVFAKAFANQRIDAEDKALQLGFQQQELQDMLADPMALDKEMSKLKAELAELTKQRDAYGSQFAKEHPWQMMANLMGRDSFDNPYEVGMYGVDAMETQMQMNNVIARINMLTEAKNAFERGSWSGHGFWNNVKNIGKGMQQFATEINSYTDKYNIESGMALNNLANKIERGEMLTDEEMSWFVTAKLKEEGEKAASQGPTTGAVGYGAPASLEYMVTMALNPARGVSKTISDKIIEAGVRRFGKSAFTKMMAKATGMLTEGAVLSTTLGADNVASDALGRMAGKVGFDDGGNVAVADRVNPLKAMYQSTMASTIESAVEMMGVPIIGKATKGIGKVATKLADAMSYGKVSKLLSAMDKSQIVNWTKGMSKATGWQGLGEEWAEENVTMLANAIIVGDNEIADMFDTRTQLEILGTCALISGAMSTANVAGFATEYHKVNREYKKAKQEVLRQFSSDVWASLDNLITNAQDEDLTVRLADAMDGMAMNQEQRSAIMTYLTALKRYQKFNELNDGGKFIIGGPQQTQTTQSTSTSTYEIDSDITLKDEIGNPIDAHIVGKDANGNYMVESSQPINGKRVQPMSADQLDAMVIPNTPDGIQQSEVDGYTLTDANQQAEVSMLTDNARESVATLLGVTPDAVDVTLQQVLGDNPTDVKIDARFGGNAQVVKDYMYNVAKTKGMSARLIDDIADATAESDRAIDAVDNNGNVVTAKDVNGNDVNVVSGNIVTYEDGLIDTNNSDSSVVIRHADGTTEMVAPTSLTEVESMPTEQAKATQAQAIAQQMQQVFSDRLNGVLDYSQGQQYTMLNADGSTTDVTILADNGDGNVTVTARDGNKEGGVTDGKQIVLPKSQIQQGVREFKRNQLRAESAQQTSIPHAETQPTEVAEPTQEPTMPTDEQGNIMYEQMDADSAWDALLTETDGDADMAMTVANEMIADKTKAVEEASKMVAEPGTTPQEKIANLKAVKQAQAQAQAELAKWQDIAETPNRRASLQTEQTDLQTDLQTESQGQQVTGKLPASEEAQMQEQEQSAVPMSEQGQQVTGKLPASEESTPQVGLVEDARTRTLGDKTRKMLDAMAKRLGLQVEFVDEIVTGKDEKGRNLYANAVIVGKNVKIAWHNRNRAIDFLLGHEFTHRMQDLSPEAYAEFVEATKQALGEEEWSKRINRMRDIYKSQGKTISEQGIIDEVVADYAGELVEERGVFDNFVERNKNNRGLLSRIADVLRSIKEFFTLGKQRKINNAIKQLSNLIEASEQALPGYLEAERARGQIQAETGTKPRFSVSATMIGAGFEAFAEDGKSPILDEHGNVAMRLGDKMFSARNLVSAKDIKGQGDRSPLNMMINDSLELGKIDSAKADEMYEKVADILNSFLVAGSAQKGGYANMAENWLWLGETVYRTIATNGDSQYKYSADITRVCKKNEAVIRSISALQKKVGYGITPGQIMDIYYQTSQKGYQVPCPVCYVFSRYMHNGKYATAAINGMRKYGEHLQGGKDPWTAEQWIEEYNRLVDIKNDKKNVNALKNATADVTTTLDKMDKLAEHVDRLGAQLAVAINKGDVEKQEKIRATIQLLDARYRAALNVISQQSLTNWIKMFAIEKRSGETLNEFAEEEATTTSEKGGYLNPNEWRIREDNQKPTDIEDFEEHALDLRRSAETMGKYPAITRLRKSGGSAAGKAIAFESNNEVGEFISGLNTRDPENATNWYMEAYNNPDNATYRNKAKDRFAKAVVYAEQQSLRGGQRMWSWSDYIESLGPDVVINLLQLELLGGALQTYSKQLEGNNLVARMEGYVNGSLMAHGNGVVEVSEDQIEVKDGKEVLKDAITETIQENTLHDGVKPRTRTLAEKGSPIYTDKNGKKHVLTFDDVVGIDPHGRVEGGARKKGLFDINRNLNRSGNILVGMNDTHIKTALADPRIFFVIPWHASGQSNHILSQMLNILGVNTRNFTPMDYTNMQSEKDYNKKDVVLPSKVVDLWERIKTQSQAEEWGDGGIDSNAKGQLTDSQKNYRRLRAEIFAGKYDSLSAEDKALIDNDAFLSQVKNKVGKITGGKMTNDDNNHIYPYEYWDESSTYKKADINGKRYLEYCRRLGFRPKFSGKWDKGDKWSSDGDFTQDNGYWKLLVDRRMYDIDGNFQGLTPVSVSGYSTELTDPKHNAKEFVTTQVADDQGAVDIANEVYEAESKRTEKGMPQVDYNMDMSTAVAEYNKLPKVKAGERTLIKEAQEQSQRYSLTDLTEEEQRIVDEAKANGTYLKAPNGKASNLNERQWIQVRTKAFKDWFGDWENDPENASKVVDENGEPMVVYHGTTMGGFASFKESNTGIFFADSRKAVEDYAYGNTEDIDNYLPFDRDSEISVEEVNEWISNANLRQLEKGSYIKEHKVLNDVYWELRHPNGKPYTNTKGEEYITTPLQMKYILLQYARTSPEFKGKGVYSTYLDMKNPFVIDAESKSWHKLPEVVNGIALPKEFQFVSQTSTVSTDEWARFLQSEEGRKLGFDGIIVNNVYDSETADGTTTDYIAFEPTQIKSATDNVGTFDASNPDIRFSLFGGNSGYVGYSMSKRAARAREEGRYPKTDFRKEYGVTAKSFDELVDAKIIASGEWHHTSKFGNETKFYHWDEDYYADIYEENKAVIDKLSRERKTDEIVSLFENHPLAHKAEYDNETERLVDDVNREYNDKIREVENEKRDKERAYNSAVFDALGQLTNVVKANNGNLWFNASNGVGIQIDRAGNEVSMNYGGANGSKGALRYEARNELQTAIESVAKESNIESADATYYTDKVNQLEAERAERVAQLVEAREKEYTTEQTDSEGDYGGERYSLVTDPATIEMLESAPKVSDSGVKLYRAMVEIDGKLYPPMSSMVDEDGKKVLREGVVEGDWVMSDEDLSKAILKEGKDGYDYYFRLLKDDGTYVDARYNPYLHTSDSMLNDQFKSAQSRPNLVVVEMEIPITGDYKAEGAKDAVGFVPGGWKSGDVASQLPSTRNVYLSQYGKVSRIVPTEEVAQHIYDKINGYVDVMPSNVVTPQVREALENMGVKFVETNNQSKIQEGEHKGKQWTQVYGKESIRKKAKKGKKSKSAPRYSLRNDNESENNLLNLHEENNEDNELSKSVSQRGDGKNNAKNGRLEEVASRLQSASRTSQEIGGGGESSLSRAEIEERTAEAYAKENGIWIPFVNVFKLGTPGPSGNENDTYFSPDGYVYKVNNLINSGSILPLLGKLLMHNSIFPNTKYELVGFTGFDGRSVYPVLKQSTIINPQFATKEEIDSYMTSLGFDKIEDWVFSNGDLRISDLRPRNVLKDADGDIYVVDAEIRRIKSDGKPRFSLQGGRSIADKYEKRVNTKGKGGAMHLSKFNFMEAWQDEMRALKEVQRIIEQEYGIVLESYEDAYMAENAMSSIAKASWDRYIKEVYEPMMRIHDEWIRSGESNESINHYLIAKSGLERNREFTVRDALRAERASMEESIRDAYRSAIKDLNEKYKPMELDLLDQYRSGAIDKDTYRNERKNLSDAKKAERKPIDDKYQLDMQDAHNKMTQVEEEYKAKRNALRDDLKAGNIDFAEFCRLSDDLALQYSGAEEIADYSGLNALAKMHGSKDWQGFAEQMVRDFEAKHSNTDVMWEHINNNTKSAVDYSYKSGVTSKQAKDHLDQMFLWYVPMKGNADVEAEDIYTYVNDKSSSFTPTVARAKGHTKYVSEDVMALIANTMQSAILQGERNKVKQKFLNMVQNYPTDLFSVDNGWVELQGNDWVEVFPDINENDTPEEVRSKIEDFQEKMQELANEGKAKRKSEALSLGVPFRATQNKSEHAISVMRNGEKMTIYVNGNPRVAQAINGKLKDTKESLGMRLWHTFTRWLSAGMTGYSIDFTGANLSRDTHHSSAIMFLKYGFKEQIRYILNGFADLPALIRGISGKSGNTKRDAYFQEFLANGGETGYANLRSLEDWKVENKKRIGRLRTMGGKAWGHTRNVLPYIAEAFGYINRLAETSSRFNAYVRARERNQDVATAVSEAKNITVNFNKKGSAKTAGAFGFLANLYRETMMFANPVIQGLYQFLKVGKEHKGRFTVLCLGHVALGGVVPILNQMLFELLGGDDEDEYYNQSEYQRRTNLLIYTGHGYIKIPLAPIFRELYALGDVFYGVIQKKIKMEDGAKDVVGLVRSMFSIEGQSAIDDDWSLVRFILPEQLSVVADISDNVNFMGMPIYKDSDYLRFDPEYQKVYKNAWSPLVATSAKLNELLGGDEDSAPRNANDKWLNPAIWQHVISSIGGGPLKTIGDILDISDRAISGEDLSISNIPVAKRFFMKPDERTLINAVNREYYGIKEDMAWVEDRVRKFNRKEYSGYAGYAEKLDFMYHSPDYLKYAIFEEGNKEIEKLDKKIKEEVDEKEIENLKAMSATKKDQLISKVNAVDRITETDSKDPLLAHYIGKDVAYKMRKRLKQAQIADVDNPGALSEYTQTPEFEIDMEIADYVNQIAQIDYYLNDDLMRLLTGQSRAQLEATKASLRESLVELREAYEKRLKNKEEGEQ